MELDTFTPDGVNTDPEKQTKPTLEGTSLWSTLSLSYMNPILKLGKTKPLEEDDVLEMPENESIWKISQNFKHIWQLRKQEGDTSIIWSLFECVKWRLQIATFGSLLYAYATLNVPHLVQSFVEHLETRPSIDVTAASMVAFFLILTLGSSSLLSNMCFYNAMRAGVHVRAAAMAAIYEKTLRLSRSSIQMSNTGETVTLMSNDAERFYEAVHNLPFLMCIPICILGGIALLVLEVGWASLAGFAVILLVALMQSLIGRKIVRLRSSMLKHTDERLNLTGEVLRGIRVVKMYAWEKPLSESLSRIRSLEVSILSKMLYLKGLNFTASFSWSVLASAGIISTYALLGNDLTYSKIFGVLAILSCIRVPLIIFSNSIHAVSEGLVSSRRISQFLLLPELHDNRVEGNETGRIMLRKSDFSWSSSGVPVLHNLDFCIRPGELVGIVGSVGSGKTALLSAILGELHLLSGSIELAGPIAFMGQAPWIRNQTLRDNILLGLDYDPELYQTALRGSALEVDIANLPDGDQTEIGERGINLSGGQQSRVSLARVIYRRGMSSIVLLDDVLSAVDMNVGKQMFDFGIIEALAGSTRIVTLNSHLHHLKNFDRIIVLQDCLGGERDSVAGEFTDYEEMIAQFPALCQREEGAVHGQEVAGVCQDVTLDDESLGSDLATEQVRKFETNCLVGAEDREVGQVGVSAYRSFLRCASGGHSVAAFLVLVLLYSTGQTARMATDFWVSMRIEHDGIGDDFTFWLTIYIFWAIVTFSVSVAATCTFLTFALRASRCLHDNLIDTMLRAPISTFFDVTPLGRVLNRFGRDLDQVDLILPEFMVILLFEISTLIGAMIVACVASPYFIGLILSLGVIFYFIQAFFRCTSRELKRLEGISRSPVFSLFEETLLGLSTIRAFKMQRYFVQETHAGLSRNTKLFCSNVILARWLSLRLDMLNLALVSCVAFSSIWFLSVATSTVFAGLALVYAMEFTGTMQHAVRMSVEVENNMTAVERLLHYTSVKSEAPTHVPETDPGADWPSQGAIELVNLRMRYRPELNLVLKDMCVCIRPGEKVGIIGRTGSGKSSTALALLRMIEPENKKSIIIDGIDVGAIGLTTLRRAIAIIPQEAVLFSGTLRFNLDPYQEHSDEEIWDALQQVHLKGTMSSLKNGLEHVVAERGQNFSYGQRQLICIARAFLRNSKIIIADEASAGIDSETDQLIQKSIRHMFHDRTVLTIAHRLHTVADSDRIMVLSGGEVQEFDTPEQLLRDTNSAFYNMVQQSGSPGVVADLLQIALRARQQTANITAAEEA